MVLPDKVLDAAISVSEDLGEAYGISKRLEIGKPRTIPGRNLRPLKMAGEAVHVTAYDCIARMRQLMREDFGVAAPGTQLTSGLLGGLNRYLISVEELLVWSSRRKPLWRRDGLRGTTGMACSPRPCTKSAAYGRGPVGPGTAARIDPRGGDPVHAEAVRSKRSFFCRDT